MERMKDSRETWDLPALGPLHSSGRQVPAQYPQKVLSLTCPPAEAFPRPF